MADLYWSLENESCFPISFICLDYFLDIVINILKKLYFIVFLQRVLIFFKKKKKTYFY